MSLPGRHPERIRFPGVRAPKPLLSPETERRLTERQRQVLDALEELVLDEGFAEKTMAKIASEMNCSMRTLYEIAPSKDELVLAVVDRQLRRIGRAAVDSLDPSLPPLEMLRAYLRAANEAVQPTTTAFSREFSALPGAKSLLDAHEGYVMAVTQSLLEGAIASNEIRAVDTAAVAHVLGGLGREFSRAEAMAALVTESPKDTADALSDIILRGLAQG